MSDQHKITTSGYAGYWTASCDCGWVGQAFRSVTAFNTKFKAEREGNEHIRASREENVR